MSATEFTLEKSMDILVLYPEQQPELITIPTDENPFEYFFGKYNFYEGHSSGNFYFAYHRSGRMQGYQKNIALGNNPFYTNIYGPIVFAYSQASINAEIATKILEQYEIYDKLLDYRVFKNRKIFYLQDINVDKLIETFPKSYHSPNYEDKKKFYIKGHEELSDAVYQLISSYYGTFLHNFQKNYLWNPLEVGFETEINLKQFAKFVIKQFEEEKLLYIEEIRLGIMSQHDASNHLSRMHTLIKPIQEALSKELCI